MRNSVLKSLIIISLLAALLTPPGDGLADQTSPQTALKPQLTGSTLPANAGSPKQGGDEDADLALERMDDFYARRTAGDPNTPFTLADAGKLRAAAAEQIVQQETNRPSAPSEPNGLWGSWTSLGPDPTVSMAISPDSNFIANSGRITALAIRSTAPYSIYLGTAQGGVWISSTLTSAWIPRTDSLASLAIGSIALAPSNENIIYVGTGEGNLSGDSYYGNGILKSTDGGQNFSKVSGNYLTGVSIPQIAVDPTNPNHLFAAVNGGNAGFPSVRPPAHSTYGIWVSSDGGVTWAVSRPAADVNHGAAGVVFDPQNPLVVYASFIGEGILKTTSGGLFWNTANTGLPAAAASIDSTSRFALGISRPLGSPNATLYTGFDYYSPSHVQAMVWKSTDDAVSWAPVNNAVQNYCDSQCFYNNAIGVDPTNPNIVYALGMFNYAQGTGGIFRSMDGGATWTDLGYHLHPDFHAIAIRTSDPSHVVVGNDGGVWVSHHYGGRSNPADPATAVDWSNLNGKVNPITSALLQRTGLSITQFHALAINPTLPNRVYAGAQDNGLQRRGGTNTWFNLSGGDGGQVLVDRFAPQFVYHTYYNLSPMRISDAGLNFFSSTPIQTGINQLDRTAFYPPFEMDPNQTSRLYIGSYRLYRSDNRGDAWTDISSDLTSGCTNRATSPTTYSCVITAIGVTGGGPGVYVGTGDGKVWFNAKGALDPALARQNWVEVTKAPLPTRPVSAIAVDPSNDRIALIAYSSFDAATPSQPGHIFLTLNGGQNWISVSGNLPDISVNDIVMDPQYSGFFYAATDAGPMVSTNSGANWSVLGSGFPLVAFSKLIVDPFNNRIVAATYGRGAFQLPTYAEPALELKVSSSAAPVGPGSLLTYTLALQNFSSAAITNLSVTSPLPANTTFVRASDGGVFASGSANWSVPALGAASVSEPTYGAIAPGVKQLTFTILIGQTYKTGDQILLNPATVSFSWGSPVSSSPYAVSVANALDFSLSPASLLDGGRAGSTVNYTVTLHNLGYQTSSYQLTAQGGKWKTTFWKAGFTSQASTVANVAGGHTTSFGVQVSIPLTVTMGVSDTVQLKVTANSAPLIQTIPLRTLSTRPILLVNQEDVSSSVQSRYTAALDAHGYSYDVWNLTASPSLPAQYLNAHRAIIWYTGQSYPDPLGPYETELALYLDHGGGLFVSGMDILDQSAGTAPFVKNYLHIQWDGTEAQNDKVITGSITGVVTNTLTASLGPYTTDFAAIGFSDFSDLLTPIIPARPALVDGVGVRAIHLYQGAYKIWFLGFPFEAISDPTQRANLMQKVVNDLLLQHQFLPIVKR